MTGNMRSQRDLTTQSGKTSLLIGLGLMLKMVVDLFMASTFGLGIQTDAFVVAYTLPLIIEALIYPTFQAGLVPVFVRAIHSDWEAEDWIAYNTLAALSLVISLVLMGLGIASAAWTSRLLAPGMDPDTRALSIRLMHILFAGTLFVGPVGVQRAYLNADNAFTAPALLEFIRGASILILILVGRLLQGTFQIEVVALGYVVGAWMQLVILGSAITRRFDLGYPLSFNLRALRALRPGRLLSVNLLDCLFRQSILVLERIIGSFMPTGTITAINYGHRLSSVIGTVLFSGIEVVSLSALAQDFASGVSARRKQAGDILAAGMRLIVILGIPAALSVLALSVPLVQLLFERQAFTQQDTRLVAAILGLYTLSVPFYGYWLLLKNYLVAERKLNKLLAISCLMMVTHIVLAILLSPVLGARGVALAAVAGTSVSVVLGFTVLDDRDIQLAHRSIGLLAVKVTGAAIGVGIFMQVVTRQAAQVLHHVTSLSGFTVPVLSLAIAGTWGLALLLGLFYVLRIEEAVSLFAYLKKRSTQPEYLHNK
jgi:putative peptidoglycan lipid II flippase